MLENFFTNDGPPWLTLGYVATSVKAKFADHVRFVSSSLGFLEKELSTWANVLPSVSGKQKYRNTNPTRPPIPYKKKHPGKLIHFSRSR